MTDQVVARPGGDFSAVFLISIVSFHNESEGLPATIHAAVTQQDPVTQRIQQLRLDYWAISITGE